MEEIEIALALLEIIAILFPLSLVALGLGFRLVQSPEGHKVLRLLDVLQFAKVAGAWLFLLITSGALILFSIFSQVDSLILRLATWFLVMAFGFLAGFVTSLVGLYFRSDEATDSSGDGS